MSRFKNPSNGDVIDVPDALDAMYSGRGFEPYDPDAVSVEDFQSPAATAPAGSSGELLLPFDPADPLRAGAAVALDNIESIKGESLDRTLADLGLEKSGTADEKRDRLAARLNEEVNGG